MAKNEKCSLRKMSKIKNFWKNGKNEKFPGLNVNRLEIKQPAQRDMTFLAMTYIFVMAAQKTELFW